MKPFLAGVVTTVIVLFVSFYVFGYAITGGQGFSPQVIDCRNREDGAAVFMEIFSTREHGEFVTFRALGCTGYWHVNSRT
jgi:hypothetical protein